MFKTIKLAAIALTALTLAGGAAQATPVPAGTLIINGAFSPTVDLTADTIGLFQTPQGYKRFTDQNGTGQFATADSSINGTDAPGSTSGATLSFDPKVGNVISYTASPLANLLVFTDSTSGETYRFALDNSITTLSDQTTGAGTTIGLYLLGDLTATGTTTYSTLTPTALTLSLTTTGGSSWSLSGTLANPPPGTGLPVPEPTSMALLGGGLAALGFVRRRSRKN